MFLHRLNLLELYYGIYREVDWKRYGHYLLPKSLRLPRGFFWRPVG